MAHAKFESEYVLRGMDVYITATIAYDYDGHDGIGPYEYWGSVGYDRGNPVWEPNLRNSEITVDIWDEETGKTTVLNLTKEETEEIFAFVCDHIDNGDIEVDEERY